ncbi:hypothetical protein D3C72_608710 [compost metagenome]
MPILSEVSLLRVSILRIEETKVSQRLFPILRAKISCSVGDGNTNGWILEFTFTATNNSSG